MIAIPWSAEMKIFLVMSPFWILGGRVAFVAYRDRARFARDASTAAPTSSARRLSTSLELVTVSRSGFYFVSHFTDQLAEIHQLDLVSPSPILRTPSPGGGGEQVTESGLNLWIKISIIQA